MARDHPPSYLIQPPQPDPDRWQADGDTFVAILFGLITTIGVVLQAIHIVRNWHRVCGADDIPSCVGYMVSDSDCSNVDTLTTDASNFSCVSVPGVWFGYRPVKEAEL